MPELVFTTIGWTSCLTNYLRILLNEYSTGCCILATAYFRYWAVCRPLDSPPKKFHLKTSVVILVLVIGSLLIGSLDLLLNHKAYLNYTGTLASEQNFLIRCNYLPLRHPLRLSVEVAFFFAFPFILAGWFYNRNIATLLKLQKQQDRNRNLSAAFVVSWILWAFCWIPSYVISLTNLSSFNNYSSLGRASDRAIAYLVTLSSPLQMLYSHLNPFLYLLILKDFQNYVMGIYRKLLFKRNAHDKNPGKPSGFVRGTFGNAEPLNKKRKIILVMRKTIISIFAVGFIICLILLASLAAVSVFTNDRAVSYKVSAISMHGNFRVTKLKVVSFQDITPFSGESQSAKTFCAQNHGVFRFSVGRCFFVLDHGYPRLNFSQQVELCGENGAVLSYPRSQEEVETIWEETIWEVFREHLESSGEKVTFEYVRNLTIHVGFQRRIGRFNQYSFTSVDGMLTVNSRTYGWLRDNSGILMIAKHANPIEGPALCISRAKVVSKCMPRTKKRYSVCSRNFALR